MKVENENKSKVVFICHFVYYQEALIWKAHYCRSVRYRDRMRSYSMQSYTYSAVAKEFPDIHIPYKMFVQVKDRIVLQFDKGLKKFLVRSL